MDRVSGKWKRRRRRGVVHSFFSSCPSSMLLFLNENKSKSILNVMWTAKGKKDSLVDRISGKWKGRERGVVPGSLIFFVLLLYAILFK